MRTVALICLCFSIQLKAQDTTWYKTSQLDNWDYVSLGVQIKNSDTIVGNCSVRNQGGLPNHRLAFYNRQGELLDNYKPLEGYFDFSVYSYIYFKDGSFLAKGDGTSPRSANANWGKFLVLYDSSKDLVFERLLSAQSISAFFKSSDTTFLATEYNGINNYLTHFNLHGDTLWQTTWQDLLQLSALPAPFDYRVLTILYRDSIAEVWFQENNGSNQWLSRINSNTGQVIETKQYQLGDLEYIVRVWNGYMYSFNTLIREVKLFYCDISMQTIWEKTYESSYKTSVYFGIVNHSNQVMYSVVHNEYDSTHIYINKHWYTRIYTVDSLGNEIAAWQYYDKDVAFSINVRYEFPINNFLMGVSGYNHLSNLYSSEMMRSNADGQVLNSDWPDYVPFPDVTVFDPYATEPLEVSETINSASGISIYPNPTQNQVTIDLRGNPITNIYIYSINGNLVKEINGIESKHHLQLNLEDFSNGVYFIRLADDNNSFTHKLILVK